MRTPRYRIELGTDENWGVYIPADFIDPDAAAWEAVRRQQANPAYTRARVWEMRDSARGDRVVWDSRD